LAAGGSLTKKGPDMDIAELKERYLKLPGMKIASEAAVTRIEERLHLKLPDDFIEISMFYGGGLLGNISHHSINDGGPADNIVDETLRIWAAIPMPKSMIVIAEPPASLIVLDTKPQRGAPVVIWCDDVDAANLSDVHLLRKPNVWDSYAEFFSFLLDQEEEAGAG
jgi:hypothetical protein